MSWTCQRPGCGHNRSAHRYEKALFKAGYNTSCRGYVAPSGPGQETQCSCGAFLEEAP